MPLITVEFGEDVLHEKEAYQIVMDALLEFASRRGCRDAGFEGETLDGARKYVSERYGDKPPCSSVDEKAGQVARRASAARRAVVRHSGMS